MKSFRICVTRHVRSGWQRSGRCATQLKERTNLYGDVIGELDAKRSLGRPRHRNIRGDNIKVIHKETGLRYNSVSCGSEWGPTTGSLNMAFYTRLPQNAEIFSTNRGILAFQDGLSSMDRLLKCCVVWKEPIFVSIHFFRPFSSLRYNLNCPYIFCLKVADIICLEASFRLLISSYSLCWQFNRMWPSFENYVALLSIAIFSLPGLMNYIRFSVLATIYSISTLVLRSFYRSSWTNDIGDQCARSHPQMITITNHSTFRAVKNVLVNLFCTGFHIGSHSNNKDERWGEWRGEGRGEWRGECNNRPGRSTFRYTKL